MGAVEERIRTWACSTAFTANLSRRLTELHGGAHLRGWCRRHVNSLLLDLHSSQNNTISHGRTHAVSHNKRTSIRFCALLGSNWVAILSLNWLSYTQAQMRESRGRYEGKANQGVLEGVARGKLATCSFRRDVLARARKIVS